MSVHMIRYIVSPDADSYLIDSYLPQWLTTHSAWDGSDHSNQAPTLTDPQPNSSGDTSYYIADWRFAWGDNSKEVLLSNLTSYTQSYAPWYRVGYHVCDHDTDERSGCEWDDQQDAGTVPDHIPVFVSQ